MIRGVAGQKIGAEIVSATTGAAFAGTVVVYVTGDAGTQAIGSVGGGVCTLEGNGYYTYAPSAVETNYDLIGFTFIGTGAVPATVQIFTVTAAQAAQISAAGGVMATTARAICTNAALEIGYLDAVETLSAPDAAFILRKLNRLLDNWNAQRDAVYADVFTTYPFTPNLSPHTIGPTGTWVTAQRPVSIDGANLMLSATVRTPIRIRDRDWWYDQSVPTLATGYPLSVYYDPTWPNGSLYFWPVPTGLSVELLTRTVLTTVALATTFSLPPGYEDAITLTLAQSIAGPLGSIVSPDLKEAAAQARATIFTNNRTTPRLWTRDSGIPGRRGALGYNYLSGSWD